MRDEYTVDEHGRCGGFAPGDDDLEVGPFGDGLEPGTPVVTSDGDERVVEKVLTRIHTGSAGTSHYVYVLLKPPGDDDGR